MNIKNFIKENLINGFCKGVWTSEEVNIMLLNYQLKGLITEEDITEIINEISPEQTNGNNEVVEEQPTE